MHDQDAYLQYQMDKLADDGGPPDMGRGVADNGHALASIGLTPVVPCVRSSDDNTTLEDPYKYFLRRILGLVPALDYAPALSQGKWIHTRFEMIGVTEQKAVDDHMNMALLDVYDHICDLANIGVGDTTITRMKDTARTDMILANSWYEGAAKISLPGYGTFVDYIMRDEWEIVCAEEDIRIPFRNTFITIRPDLVLYNKKKNTFYIVDLKSCAEATVVRGMTCPYEFQTWLYPWAFRLALQHEWINHLQIPCDAKMGGMIHVLVRKPTIRLAKCDRPFIMETDDKGKEKKVYTDEPDPAAYAVRCSDWYAMEMAQFTKSKDSDPNASPPVNISFTSGDLFEDILIHKQFHESLERIHHYSTMKPEPFNFPRNFKAIRSYGRISPYAPFYICPIQQWPEIIAKERFVVEHRDPVPPMPST